MYAQFSLVTPAGVGDAIEALSTGRRSGATVPLGGGTNLIVDLRARRATHEMLISVARLPGLLTINVGTGQIAVGGAVTVSQILRHPEHRRFGDALVQAAQVFAGQMVRNTATVAGNICCGSPAADLVPPLMALDATVRLESKSGSREVALADYFTGYKTSVRRPDELLTAVHWPEPEHSSASAFHKLARRKGDAITVVGVAVSLNCEGGRCAKPRIALGAVGPAVARARSAEALLDGQSLTPELIEAAAQAAMAEASPIDDVRASAAYRKEQVAVLVRRLVSRTWQKIAEGEVKP